MMSRITIDLRKSLSRDVVTGDRDGVHCYRLSHIRFRNVVTDGSMSTNNIRMPRVSTSERNLDNPNAAADASTSRVARGFTDRRQWDSQTDEGWDSD